MEFQGVSQSPVLVTGAVIMHLQCLFGEMRRPASAELKDDLQVLNPVK